MTSQVLPTNVPSKNRAALLRLAARMAEEAELIGRRMAERRKELGLTQREVAERMSGKTEGSDVSRWERGKHRPEPMPQIAEALETTIADLVSGPTAERQKRTDADLSDALSDAEPGSSRIEQMLQEILDQQAALLADVSSVRTFQEDLSPQLERLLRAPARKRKGSSSA